MRESTLIDRLELRDLVERYAMCADSGDRAGFTFRVDHHRDAPAQRGSRVCAAPPGLLSHLDLPLWAGGYVARR